ncbi:MAG: methyl-accepting chemotaxis protein [Treponema sp.]|nr:methyl-accepting chemotaxis protein [Treponema sp.]
MKLSLKIPLLIGAAVLIASASIGAASIFISLNLLEKTAHLSLLNQAMLGRDMVVLDLHSRLNVLQELANSESVRSMDWERQKASLSPSVARLGYLDLAIVDLQGQARYIKEDTISDLADRDYIIKALHGSQAVSEVLISKVINKPVVMFAVPITNDGGGAAGALIGRQDGTSLNEVTKDVKFGSSGYSYMTNKSGVIISHQNIDFVLNQYNPIKEAVKNPAMQSLADLIRLSQRENMDSAQYTLEGREMVAGFAPIPGFEWTLFVTIDRKELLSGMDRMVFLVVSFGAAFIATGLVVAYLLGRSISRPINNLSVTLKDISEGEGDLAKVVDIKAKNELADLARYFNLTMGKIKSLVLSIRKEADALSQTGAALAADMTQTAVAVEQIAANVKSVTSRTGTQQASAKETSALMADVVDNVNTLNDQIQKQADCVNQSSSAIEEMLANIQSVTQSLVDNNENLANLAQASNAGRDSVQEVAAAIQEIDKESAGLLEINAVMQNIASQTNLLSMNAAIEAAHAGEAGKGFAVVADEIRKLAESSGEQSKTISGVLKRIKDSIDRIAKSTEGTLLKFEAISDSVARVTDQEGNVRSAMEEQGTGSKQILEAVSDLQEMTGVIRNRTGAMREKSLEAIKKSQELEQITGEISQGMREMATGADQINEAVNHVNNISGENKRQIEALVGEVSLFKVE